LGIGDWAQSPIPVLFFSIILNNYLNFFKNVIFINDKYFYQK